MGREGAHSWSGSRASATSPRSRARWPTSAPLRPTRTLVHENLNRTKNEFERSKELLASGNESKAGVRGQAGRLPGRGRRATSRAQDQVSQANAALKQARDDLSKTTIYAPMAGTISALNKEQGEIALGSQFQKDVILVIGDLTQMEAQVNVDENDVGSIAIGQTAEIRSTRCPTTR